LATSEKTGGINHENSNHIGSSNRSLHSHGSLCGSICQEQRNNDEQYARIGSVVLRDVNAQVILNGRRRRMEEAHSVGQFLPNPENQPKPKLKIFLFPSGSDFVPHFVPREILT
jgi:hypothetical protein